MSTGSCGQTSLFLLFSLSLAIELYKRFVDDITAALGALAPGTRFYKNENKMEIVASLIESDKEEPDDRRTFEELKQIANSIYSMFSSPLTHHPATRKECAQC